MRPASAERTLPVGLPSYLGTTVRSSADYFFFGAFSAAGAWPDARCSR